MSENSMCCPQCSGEAIKDHEERVDFKVTAIIIHGYCRRCGDISETIYAPDNTKKGKELARRLAQGI